MLAKGDTSAATGWLRRNVQCHGGLYRPKEVIAKACRTSEAKITEAPLLAYLKDKFAS
jgi:carboxypeptidase Taq